MSSARDHNLELTSNAAVRGGAAAGRAPATRPTNALQRVGSAGLQLTSPVRMARAASAGRLQLSGPSRPFGGAARPPVVNAVRCTPTHSGVMKKVLPVLIGCADDT